MGCVMEEGEGGKGICMPTNIKQAEPAIAPQLADLPVRGHRMSFLFWFDTSLLLLFLLIMTPRLTGLAIHEIAGVVFVIFFLLHILLSWQWIKAAARKLVTKGAWRMRVNSSLNGLLFAFTCIAIVAGLVISQVVLPALRIPSVNDSVWHFLHNRMASWVRICIGLHIAMNWQWIVAAVRRQAASRRGRGTDAQRAALAQPLDLLEEDAGD